MRMRSELYLTRKRHAVIAAWLFLCSWFLDSLLFVLGGVQPAQEAGARAVCCPSRAAGLQESHQEHWPSKVRCKCFIISTLIQEVPPWRLSFIKVFSKQPSLKTSSRQQPEQRRTDFRRHKIYREVPENHIWGMAEGGKGCWCRWKCSCLKWCWCPFVLAVL